MRVDIGGTHLWYDIEGPVLEEPGGPSVVLLHGGPGSFDHSYFKPDFSRLSSIARVIYLDLPGHGRSDWGSAAEWRFEKAADDVHAFCETLEIASPIVLGHSFGGLVAIEYAARHPDHLSGLILQSTFARFDLDRIVEGFRDIGGDDIAQIVRRTYERDETVTPEEWGRCWRLFGPWVPGEKEMARIPRNEELNVSGGLLMLHCDIRDSLASITCPTLVSVGRLDPITPVSAGEEMVDRLANSDARLDVIESAGHFPWRDRPDDYWASIERFIERVRDR
jgi:proline iminopeptidase